MQLSLTQSDISHIGSMRVEGIVHPTTAEIDLKEDIGKVLRLGEGCQRITRCLGESFYSGSLSTRYPELGRPCHTLHVTEQHY